MTLHYHGTPITPISELGTLAGRCFCVSFADPRDIERCHEIGQSVMLDNGAFSFWRSGTATNWPAYYAWAERWLDHRTTWAVIPDLIDGDEPANDLLIAKYPRSLYGQSAPVWHMHESLDRLVRLSVSWSKVCIGSSGQYRVVGSPSWHRRMEAAMNRLCGNGPTPVWLHMLRGMAMVDQGYPFASVDSSDIAQNHHRNGNSAAQMAARWDGKQAVSSWMPRTHLSLDDCICGYEGPDSFGNYDQIENDECPLHGVAP